MVKTQQNGFSLLEVTLSMVMLTVLAVGTANVMVSQRNSVGRNEEKMYMMQLLEEEAATVKDIFMNQTAVNTTIYKKKIDVEGSMPAATITIKYWTQNMSQPALVAVTPPADISALAVGVPVTVTFDQTAYYMRADFEIAWHSSAAGNADRKETLKTFIFREKT